MLRLQLNWHEFSNLANKNITYSDFKFAIKVIQDKREFCNLLNTGEENEIHRTSEGLV